MFNGHAFQIQINYIANLFNHHLKLFMRKLLFAFLVLAFVSCKSSKDEWNKEALVKKCKENAGKDKNLEAQMKAMGITMSEEQKNQICECSVDATLAKYKTKAEADKDVASVDAIGSDCANKILMPEVNIPDTTITTNPADTTNQ